MRNRLLLALGCTLLAGINATGKEPGTGSLKRNLELTIAPYMATVGIAITDLEDNSTVLVNNNHRYPMQSVYKFPLAIYILNLVDKGELKLNQVVHIKKEQLERDTWGPLARENKDVDVKLSELLRLSVSVSDNNACDILFKLAGGTRFVHQYYRDLGINGIAISATESEMHSAWSAQYNNWCQPSAMQEILRLFYEGKLLSKKSNDYLMKLMVESENSTRRIKGELPKDVVVAHKTGTSSMNEAKIIAATNDVGIITLPNGHHLAIVVYVSDYKGGVTTGENIIASVAKCAWDYYTAKK
ncbi:MAG: class beta-lactamase [Flavipsychrobacter sp.]|jgi:beta-lactamase class A|nr:class beta-lactamase [Flavipsychrobacter sp.]